MFEAFRLKGAVGRDMSVDLDDAFGTKKALRTLGHFQTPSYGLTEYPDDAMIDGLKSFQRAHGLRVDGVMHPDGPTMKRVNLALQATANVEGDSAARRRPANGGTRVAQVAIPPGATPVVPGAGGAMGSGGLPQGYRYRGPNVDWADAWSRLPHEMQTRILQAGSLPLATKTFLEGLTAGDDERPSPTQPSPTARTQIADPQPPLPPSEPPGDDDKLPSKTTLPRPRPEDLGPPTEIFPNPEERWELIESFPDQSDELLQGLILQNSRGAPETQLATDIAIYLLDRAYKKYGLKADHENGGHTLDKDVEPLTERLVKAIAGLRAARADASFVINDGMREKHIDDIQTQDTWKDGKTPTARERRNTDRLGSLKIKHGERGDIIEVPKFRHWYDFKKWYETVETQMDDHARTKAEKLKAAKGKTSSHKDR